MRDYRLVENIDARGRIKTTYEYIGKAYYYVLSPEAARRGARRALICCAAGWLAFAGALLPLSTAARTVYVALPFAFAALPLGMMTALTFGQLSAKEPLEHRLADQAQNRCPACSFFTALLSGAGLLGEGVNLLRGLALLPGDGLFSLGAAALMACALTAHRQWKALQSAPRPGK